MKDTLTIALSKGKLLEPAIDLFKRVGLAPKDISPESRRLIFEHPASGTTLMIVRPSDVPTYVEYGAVDAGIVGADILMEQAADVYEPLDLGFGFCRLAVAAPKSAIQQRNGRHATKLRVATKYPNMTAGRQKDRLAIQPGRRQGRSRGENDPQGRGEGRGRRGEPLYPPV